MKAETDPDVLIELQAIPFAGPPAVPIPRIEAMRLQQLADVLRGAGYPAVQELQNGMMPAPLESSEGHLATLRRLFWRGENVPEREAAEALAPVHIHDLSQDGLLQQNANGVWALFQIQVYDGLLFIVDFLPREQPPDLVLPIGPSGRYLASVTIRKPVESALDLGCGCGIQALLISRHARHVTATDINPRALDLTNLNARLNGVSNVETLLGSYFEPVAGRTFGLIVANLPYVITPDNKYVYRDLGSSDDLPIRQNVEQMPLYLEEGGFAHVMLNWIHGAKQAWWEPLEDWTRRRNVDGWLVYSHSQSPQQYTKQWLWMDEKEQPEEYARRRDAWLDWYAAHDIERLAFGLLTLRRRTSTDNWRCSIQVGTSGNEPLGPHILHLFESQDALANIRRAEDLLSLRLRPLYVKLERQAQGQFMARTTRGMLIRVGINELTAKALSHLDGKRDLRAAIRRARLLQFGSRVKAERLVAEEVYRLMNLGMVTAA